MQEIEQRDGPHAEAGKKPYMQPTVRVYGRVAELTNAGSRGDPELATESINLRAS